MPDLEYTKQPETPTGTYKNASTKLCSPKVPEKKDSSNAENFQMILLYSRKCTTYMHTHTHTFTHKWQQSSICQHDSLDTMLKKCKEHLHTSRHLILNSNSFHRISEDHPHPEAMRDPSTSKQEIILLLRIWKHLN